ncbi:MAG: rod shape-determining protein MreC [Gammaproteobacteria bacterium]
MKPNLRRQVMLNKGMNHGVYLGQPVVDANGVTGQITHVGPFTSTAMLITDPNMRCRYKVIRSGVRGIASSGDDEVLSLNFVPTNADIRVGDLIVSSGLGGRFPSGYPVGEVSKVVRTPGVPFAKITVTPSAQLARTQQVLLLWPEEKPKEVAGTSLPAREVE